MKINKHSICSTCGCYANCHTSNTFYGSDADIERVWADTYLINAYCSGSKQKPCTCKKFMPDNLSYIEYLAEKRGLV
jgi:hypothetical protein